MAIPPVQGDEFAESGRQYVPRLPFVVEHWDEMRDAIAYVSSQDQDCTPEYRRAVGYGDVCCFDVSLALQEHWPIEPGVCPTGGE